MDGWPEQVAFRSESVFFIAESPLLFMTSSANSIPSACWYALILPLPYILGYMLATRLISALGDAADGIYG